MPVPGPRLGVDLGGSTITAVICGEDARVLSRAEGLTGEHGDPQIVLDHMAELASVAAREAGLSLSSLVGAGVGLPGEVEPAAGIFRASPILPTWRNVPVGQGLRERLGLAVSIENDGNATLLGEWAFGAGQGADPVLLLTLGTGIGGAVLVNGRLLSGFRGSAGEVGHLSVDTQGPLCWCGGRGCLGLLASATGLVTRYKAELGLPPDAPMDGRTVALAFAAGDQAAAASVDAVARHLADGIAGAAVVIAPERVVLFGGILGGLGEALIVGVRRRLQARPYPAVIAALEVVLASLGPLAGAIGASLLPFQDAKEARP